jgi:transcriptional regulator with XRE-family HTH domain
MHKFYTPWNSFLQYLLDRERLSQSDFAASLGMSVSTFHGYLLGRNKPPLDELPRWAELLKLVEHDREQFLWLAHETHTPSVVWTKVNLLAKLLEHGERDAAALRQEASNLKADLVQLQTEIARLRSDLGQLSGEASTALQQNPKRSVERFPPHSEVRR